jgi:hypothetical protein
MDYHLARSKIECMRMLCCNSQFGPTLFDMITPVDLRSFQYAFGIKLTETQVDKYMVVWRQLFVTRSPFDYLESRKFWVSLTGPYLDELEKLIRNPYVRRSPNKPMTANLFLCKSLPQAPWWPTSPDMTERNHEQVIEILTEIRYNQVLKDSIRYGVRLDFAHKVGRFGEFPKESPGPCHTEVTLVSMCSYPSRPVDVCSSLRTYKGMRVGSLMAKGNPLWMGSPDYENECVDRTESKGACLSVSVKSHMSMRRAFARGRRAPLLVSITNGRVVTPLYAYMVPELEPAPPA